MFVKYKINPFTLLSGTTATTINIPINLEFQIVDNAELVERVFVDVETQKAINPILDYDKVRFIPVDDSGNHVVNVSYNLYFLNGSNVLQIPSYYSTIGFDDADIRFERNNFTQSFINLGFYDSDNALTQNLMSEIDIYSMLTKDDFYPKGIAKPNIAGQSEPASQIPVKLTVSNPLLVKKAFYEGYHIYDYKDDITIGFPKFLYMKAAYFNAKTGSITNMMTEPTALTIDNLVNKLYTRYKLYRDTSGFFYQVDDTYSSNVTYTVNAGNPNNSDVTIKLYQIQAL